MKANEENCDSDVESFDQDNAESFEDNDCDSNFDQCESVDGNQKDEIDGLSESFVTQKPKPFKRKASNIPPSQNKKLPKKSAKESYMDDMELSLIKSLKDDLKDDKKVEKQLDSIDLFVRSLGADLRALNQREFFMAKHEIQNVVFKYQMARFGRDPLCSPPSAGNFSSGSQHNQAFHFSSPQMDGYNH